MASDILLMNWKCHDCNMSFSSPGLLQKHKGKFCVGGTYGDPDTLLLRRGLRHPDEFEPRPLSPEERSDKTIVEKVSELHALKDRRSRQRQIRDIEERMLLDNLDSTDAALRGKHARHKHGAVKLSKHPDLRKLQIDYERLRERERQNEAGHNPYPTARYSRNSSSSMSIHLADENDPPRYHPHTDPKLAQLAESHGRQMEMLQGRNRDLERQREEIRRRLEELGKRPIKSDDQTAALLQELRDQEARNQRLLDELKRQLMEAKQPINIIEQHQALQKPHKSFTYPMFYGGSLVAEINAMRQAYIQNGGTDPEVLSQLAQMLAEAQALEDQLRNAQQKRPKEKHHPDFSQNMMSLEMENERLQRELMFLQEQNLLAKNRRKDEREDALEHEIRRIQQDHLRKMYDLQKEIERLRGETYLARFRDFDREPARIIIQQESAPPVVQPVIQPVPQPVPQPQVQQVVPVSTRIVNADNMQPYDQYTGFVIFYDFVLNMDPRITAIRLIVGLHSSTAKMGEPTYLPMVYTEPSTRQNVYNSICNAVIGARQPVPACPPQADLGIVVELQVQGGPASEHDTQRLITRAWTKIPLFDNANRLLAGRYKMPFRNVPIKPFISFNELNVVAQYADSELYYRIVNMRDAPAQSQATIAATNRDLYNLAPQGGIVLLHHPVSPIQIPPPPPPPPSVSPPDTPYYPPLRSSRQEILPPIRTSNSSTDPTMGFQVDRVKHAEAGEGKVRLTAYYKSNGKIVQSSTSPVTCSTTAVRSNFKYGYHVFGQQEATFQDVAFQGDMILVVRFYLRKKLRNEMSDDLFLEPSSQEASLYDEETLAAWTAIPLVLSVKQDLSVRERREFDVSHMRINSGTHTLKLYVPPVPEVSRLPLEDLSMRDYKRYGKGTIRVHIFHGTPRPGSLTPSDLSDDPEDNLPEFSWLPCERRVPLKEPFLAGDGFDIYVDGCRFLPDSVTFSKIAGRILDRRYEVIGKDISTSVKLESDSYNPVYEHKEEYRLTNIPPTSTLLLKIYTIDRFYKQITVVGYATINLFVETGTERQPTIDKQGIQVSLNTGAHQLRVYNQGPNGVDPFSESCLRNANYRIVPCASVLVRLTKVPKGPHGKPLESSKVPQADWLRLGLWHPRPKYSDRIYYSMKCLPMKGESKMFHSMLRRHPMSIREAVAKNTLAKDSFLRSDKNIEQYMRNQLAKSPDVKPLEQDLNFICQYSPKHGIKIALDSAVNLPWSNFTHAHMCLNPPGAFYLGTPHATYDKLTFTEDLDLRSTNTSPAWRDGFKHFPRRSYHRFLTAIIHIQEVFVTVSRDNYKYGLLEQAWTAVQLFKDQYAYTTTFQLPLFLGAPSPQMLKQLAREPTREWMERNIRSNIIKLIEGGSIFVRICDARRDDELVLDVPSNKLVEIDTDYIPKGLEDQYKRERPGRPLATLVPQGKNPEQFVESLAVKFKSLVYKLYEEGNMNNE